MFPVVSVMHLLLLLHTLTGWLLSRFCCVTVDGSACWPAQYV